MPAPSSRPLEKVTMNLFSADCDAMRKLYGRGWTERVRRMVEQHVKDRLMLRKDFRLEGEK